MMVLWPGLLVMAQSPPKIPGSSISYQVKYIDYKARQFGAEFTASVPEDFLSKANTVNAIALSLNFASQTKILKIWKPFSIYLSPNLWFDARLPKDALGKTNNQYSTLFRFIGVNGNIQEGTNMTLLLQEIVPDVVNGFLLRFLPDVSSNQQAVYQSADNSATTDLTSVTTDIPAEFLQTDGMVDISSPPPTPNTLPYVIIGSIVGALVFFLIVGLCFKFRSRFKTGKQISSGTYKIDESSGSSENQLDSIRETTYTDISTAGYAEDPRETKWSETDNVQEFEDISGKRVSTDSNSDKYTTYSVGRTSYSKESDDDKYSEFASNTIYTDFSKNSDGFTAYSNASDIPSENDYSKVDTFFTDYSELTSRGKTNYTEFSDDNNSDLSDLTEDRTKTNYTEFTEDRTKTNYSEYTEDPDFEPEYEPEYESKYEQQNTMYTENSMFTDVRESEYYD
eukprot:NODE_35_length_36362_cov_0.944434.p6 type:complete len:452 gc:universal NODE_35_length_36362_cov_0.944434:33904-32549(-)